MDDANREQIEFWNRFPQRWASWQENFTEYGDRSEKRRSSAPQYCRGERVIDVGCGCGATALGVTAKVGPSGSVVGIVRRCGSPKKPPAP